VFHINNIINAANYESICDYSIIPPEGKVFTRDILDRSGIIFCKTDYIDYLFDNIQDSDHTYNLITHHSDHPIDEYRFSKRPRCIKKWFAINPTYKHRDLVAIPIGIKTHSGMYYEKQYMTPWFASNIEALRHTRKDRNIYCNWNVTNLDRMSIVKTLRHNNIDLTHDINQPFEKYIVNMASHKFVVSPPGNGIDCHRTWESLYSGCIPIVIKNYIYDGWHNLPILQVEDFSQVTNELLDSFTRRSFNINKLFISYWKDLITV